MGRLLNCPQCHHERVLRSRPLSASERMAALFLLSPFSCPHCSCRFMASRIGLDHPRHPMDRREHLRIPVRLFLSFSGGKVRGEGTVLDLSMGGCIIKSQTQVHVDDIFYLEIATGQQGQPLEVAAMVRSIGPRGIAFKFLRAAQENKRLLAFVQAQTADHLQKAGTPSEVPVKS
jgi:PilZ domain